MQQLRDDTINVRCALIHHLNSDVLCAERIVSFLNENFILWALSVSYPAGYEMSTTLGATSFPFLSLLDGYNMANGQHVVAEGPITADALLESLVLLMDEQGASLVAARAHKYVDFIMRESSLLFLLSVAPPSYSFVLFLLLLRVCL